MYLVLTTNRCLLRFETRNLLVTGKGDVRVIGKAEGLKAMLIEWMSTVTAKLAVIFRK
jgi:hypothetical protein